MCACMHLRQEEVAVVSGAQALPPLASNMGGSGRGAYIRAERVRCPAYRICTLPFSPTGSYAIAGNQKRMTMLDIMGRALVLSQGA
jgi:hypothetical protein